MNKERFVIISDDSFNFPIFKTEDSVKNFLEDNGFHGDYFFQGREWFRKEVDENIYLRRILNGKTKVILVKIEIQHMIGSEWVNKYDCVALC